ncbi:hypothetical protein COV16_06240 [Candidatus Woesearchaeota archaeon CG10_big_fil_rev_8_21_14_0_10_34_8]|nr:MAG: hypothetical protein COV16_06240 [Candidatus Woesearchaeota archaeon CG10_big_fil_rev_8_21_14_0_10_34_8]
MGEELEILIGFHEKNTQQSTIARKVLEREGYKVITVHSVDDMIKEMGISHGREPNHNYECPYAAIVMDVNLGNPGQADLQPALTIYDHVQRQVQDGSVKLIVVTADQSVYEKAGRELDRNVICLMKPYNIKDLRESVTPKSNAA